MCSCLQLCVNAMMPSAPLALGRAALTLIGLSARYDLYAATLGMSVLWGAGLLLRQVYRLPQVRPIHVSVCWIWHAWSWCTKLLLDLVCAEMVHEQVSLCTSHIQAAPCLPLYNRLQCRLAAIMHDL